MVLQQNIKDKIIDTINETISKTNTEKIILYGGATSKTLSERINQHTNEDKRFENMHFKLLHETNSYDVIIEAEKFLIEKLSELNNNPRYEILNAKAEDGKLIQTGGNGIRKDDEKYRLYLLINNKKYNFMENVFVYNPFNLLRYFNWYNY